MGGNIFSKTSPIPKENIEYSFDEYLKELTRIFPKKKQMFNRKHMKYVGSVNKKKISGDIDVAIDTSSVIDDKFNNVEDWNVKKKDVTETFLKLKKRARTSTDAELMMKALLQHITKYINSKSKSIVCDEKKVGISGIFGMFPQYNKDGKTDKFFQVDWMIADIKLLQFSYFSASYKGNVKGLHRTQLILSMFQNLGLSFSHMKGLSDKETKEIITTDPTEMLKILSDKYNVKITRKCSEDYFCLIKIVKKLDKKDTDSILGTYLKILDYTRTDVPEDLQDIWKERKSELKLTGKFLPSESKLLENSILRIALSKIEESK